MPKLPSGTITFLFTDIQDSTRLWEKFPAAMQQAMVRHDEIIDSLTEQHNGFVVRPRGEGDSRFVVFERAIDGVTAAAAIQQAFHAETWPVEIALRVRMGLHTGEGEFRDGDYYGTAVNRCARLRGIAHGGQTLISQTTFDLVQDNLPQGVEMLDLGEQPLKGLMRPEHIYQLMASGLPTDFPPLAIDLTISEIPSKLPTFLDPQGKGEIDVERPIFVARERELKRLNSFLAKALQGKGQIVFVTGGAGRGKTALIDEFCWRIQQKCSDLVTARGNCNAHTGVGDPYLPFRDVMGMLTGDVEPSLVAGNITSGCAQHLWMRLPQTVDAILQRGSSLIDVFVHGETLLARIEAANPDEINRLRRLKALVERKKSGVSELEQNLLFEQFTNVLLIVADHCPLVLVLDDMQWADSASLDLLFHLGRRIMNHPVLVVAAYRPEEVALGRDNDRHPLDGVVNELKRIYGEIVLDLSQDEGGDQAFVELLINTEANRLSSEFRQTLKTHTGGHALFTIELLRSMQERGDLIQDEEGQWVEGPQLDWNKLPARVEAVVEERIGRLEDDLRELLSVASVEGEDFTAQVVARVQEIKERRLLRDLSQELEKRHRLIRERDELNIDGHLLSRYRFAHQLYQRYLYNDLSAGERRLLHREIAKVLENLFEDSADNYAVQLAMHFSQAGVKEKALHYQIQAGKQAQSMYANQEAETYFRSALDLAPSDEQRAEILSNLAATVVRLDRQTEGIAIWKEAADLYEKLGKTDQIAQCYSKMARARGWSGDRSDALVLCKRGLELTKGSPESAEQATLIHETARAHYFLGNAKQAEPLCYRSLEMARRFSARRVEADTLTTLGILPSVNTKNAISALEDAVTICQEEMLLVEESRAQNNLGVILDLYTANFRRGLDHYLKAAEIWRQLGNFSGELFALCNVAGNYIALGELGEAEKLITYMQTLHGQLHESGVTRRDYMGALASFEHGKGNLEKAAGRFRELFKETLETESAYEIGYNSPNLGLVLLELGELDEAVEVLQQGVEAADQLGGHYRVLIRSVLAMVLARKSDTERARQLYDVAKEIFTEHAQGWSKMVFRMAHAAVVTAEKRWDEMPTAFQKAEEGLMHSELRLWRAGLLRDWAEAHLQRGQPEDLARAKQLFTEALDEYEAMGSTGYIERIRTRLSELEEA